jgi:tetratricopeptide (TPR) repeat protein
MRRVGILSPRDREQLERKELARGAWREGQIDNALLIIDSVLMEEVSPEVAAACYSAKAGFLASSGDFAGALETLRVMAPFLESADVRVQGTFYNTRARAHRNLNNLDAALTDYTGALALWQSCGDKNYEGAVSINLAELYLILGDIKQANDNADHALCVLPSDSEYLCNAYDTKAKILLADGQAIKALSLITQAFERAGDHEQWLARFGETRKQIKERLLDSLIPLVNIPELDDLKIRVIRHALGEAGGSVTIAAKKLSTSHQVVSYTADAHGLERSKRKKSIIKTF